MTRSLEKSFDEAMLNIYRRAKDELGYNATRFLDMLHRNGGLSTARTLINAPRESEGYTELYLRKRLDLTVKAVVLADPRWYPLFMPEELKKARARLISFGYNFD